MSDQSALDRKYFLSHDKYNCPFCNRRSVTYTVVDHFHFNWSEDEGADGYLIKCGGCHKISLHLSYFRWDTQYGGPFQYAPDNMTDEGKSEYKSEDLDSYFFYHHPTSFFTIDERIPKPIRELVAEADGCRKMNWLVGASGALRKAIYKFLRDQKANDARDDQGKALSYEDQITWLKQQHRLVAEEYFDALHNIQGMTSEELHEDKDWEPWNNEEFDYLVATIKAVLHEVYVVPEDRKQMLTRVIQLGPGKKNKGGEKHE